MALDPAGCLDQPEPNPSTHIRVFSAEVVRLRYGAGTKLDIAPLTLMLVEASPVSGVWTRRDRFQALARRSVSPDLASMLGDDSLSLDQGQLVL